MLRTVSVALLAALVLALRPLPSLADGRPGVFDYYVLSLSWSPSYCEAEGKRADRFQCGSERPFAFVVHGLWPQYERGWPDYCHMRNFRRLTEREVTGMLDIMPSRDLVRHEWKKHGTCSGLSPVGYLERMRAARKRVAVPPALTHLDDYRMVDPDLVEKAFRAANPGLPADAIAVTCDRRRLREVRICMTRELEFRPCHAVDRRGCRRDRVVMPPSRRPPARNNR